MSKQEKWNEIVKKIEELSDALDLFAQESAPSNDYVEASLYSLRKSVDELKVQDLEE